MDGTLRTPVFLELLSVCVLNPGPVGVTVINMDIVLALLWHTVQEHAKVTQK